MTGVNNEEDIIWVLIKAAGVASVYFFVMPVRKIKTDSTLFLFALFHNQ